MTLCIGVNVDLKTRQDDKTLKDYAITPGSVLHLVLALRGGRQWISWNLLVISHLKSVALMSVLFPVIFPITNTSAVLGNRQNFITTWIMVADVWFVWAPQKKSLLVLANRLQTAFEYRSWWDICWEDHQHGVERNVWRGKGKLHITAVPLFIRIKTYEIHFCVWEMFHMNRLIDKQEFPISTVSQCNNII